MKRLSNIQKIIILLSIPTIFFGGLQYLLELEHTSRIENDLSLIDFKNDPSLYWSIDKWMYWFCWLFMLVVAFILFKKKKRLTMKKLLLILLSISLFSCNNNYKEAKELYEKGILVKSKSSLDKATLKALKVSKKDSDYNKAQDILQKIDSVKYLWNNNNLIEIREKQAESQRKLNEQKRNDSLRIIESEHLIKEMNDKKTARMNQYEAKLKKDDKNYPNLVGRWILNETNYLSTLNSVVRIYQKDGVFYQSMIFTKDKSESKLELLKISNTRYNVIGKSDYCIINKEGELEFWDKEGYLLTCTKKIENLFFR